MACAAERTVEKPLAAILGPIGALSDFGPPPTTVRCTLEVGHEGRHRGWVIPFPGFANEPVEWDA